MLVLDSNLLLNELDLLLHLFLNCLVVGSHHHVRLSLHFKANSSEVLLMLLSLLQIKVLEVCNLCVQVSNYLLQPEHLILVSQDRISLISDERVQLLNIMSLLCIYFIQLVHFERQLMALLALLLRLVSVTTYHIG